MKNIFHGGGSLGGGGFRTSDLMNNLIGKKGDRSEGRKGIEVRAALLRVKIRNSDSENSRSTCFDWHNFIRTCIKYEILLHILFFGLALFFKFLILTCLFKKISASMRNMSCNFCFTSFQSTWDEGVVCRPSVVVNFSHLRTAEQNLPKLDRKQLQYHRTWPPIRMSLSLSLLVFFMSHATIFQSYM